MTALRWTRSITFYLSFSLVLACLTCTRAQRPQPHSAPVHIALRAARMVDVARGEIIEDAVILIDGDRISAAGKGLPVPPGVQVIELGQVTVLPGLIDAHTHITYHFDANGRFGASEDPSAAVTLQYAKDNARSTLEAGYTTIRNLGAGGMVDLRLRDAINGGETPGPRIVASGEPLLPRTISSGADKPERLSLIREFVKARIAEGADVIKIFEGVDERGQPFFDESDIRAAVEEAARAGRRVAVHAHEAQSIKAAVRGGCASVEHGSFLDDEAIRLLVEHHTALVPTLYLPTHYLEHRSQFAFNSSAWDFLEKLQTHNLDNARRARAGGVWIVSGSDAVAGLHGQNAREPEWLVKAGLTPAAAVRAATIDAARLLSMEGEIGELKPGRFADIVAVNGDPFKDITVLQHVAFVMKGGRVFKDEASQGKVAGAKPPERVRN